MKTIKPLEAIDKFIAIKKGEKAADFESIVSKILEETDSRNCLLAELFKDDIKPLTWSFSE